MRVPRLWQGRRGKDGCALALAVGFRRAWLWGLRRSGAGGLGLGPGRVGSGYV